jgi:hypothetical protein
MITRKEPCWGYLKSLTQEVGGHQRARWTLWQRATGGIVKGPEGVVGLLLDR